MLMEASSEIFKTYISVAIKRWDIIFWYSALNGASTIQGRGQEAVSDMG